MNFHRIANRYAKALFSLCGGDLTKAQSRLQALKVVGELFETTEAGKILRSPVMPLTLKLELLNYGLERSQADQELRQFLRAVGEAGRVAAVPEIIKSFSKIINEAAGVLEAEVQSAIPLPDEDLHSIAETLGKIFQKKVRVKPAVNGSLLGGVLVRAGNYRIDMSLKTKLDGLAQSAAQASL